MSTTTELELAPADAGENAKRADLPAIWGDFREQIVKLKTTAEALAATKEPTGADTKIARVTRLSLKEIRVAIEHRRKELGEEALRRKQGIDEQAKALKALIEPLEFRMMEIEQFAERAEEARIAALAAERAQKIEAAGGNAAHYTSLGAMDGADFELTVESLKLASEAKMKAERAAEEAAAAKAKADAEERERIRLENERLKAEAKEREAAAQAEREKAAKERAEAEAQARKEREALEAAAKAERAKMQAEAEKARQQAEAARKEAAEKAAKEREAAEAIASAERKKREAIEAQIKAEQEAERARLEKQAEAARKASTAPDKAKLQALAGTVRIIKVPECKTDDGKTIADEIKAKVEAFAAWIEKKAATL